MTRLMKASDEVRQSSVRLFQGQLAKSAVNGRDVQPEMDISAATAAPSPTQVEHADGHLRKQIGRLEAEIEQLRTQIKEASQEAEKREEDAREKGREEGRREKLEQDEKRLTLLAKGLAKAEEQFFKQQAEMEILALAIAKTTIGRVLEGRDDRSEMIGNAIAAQVERLKGELALRVQVSPEDFPGEIELRDLAGRFPQLDITARPDLTSGECVMELRFGQLDLGIPRQWSKVQEVFARLAEDRMAVS